MLKLKNVPHSPVFQILLLKINEYDLKLPGESITFALLVNVLHEIEDKMKFIVEVKRALKAEGKTAIIEWEKEKMEMGPPISHRNWKRGGHRTPKFFWHETDIVQCSLSVYTTG
ncbi:MAG: hypothetical protein A4E53_00296 [Pelotomaculum sp. PtaB.Bin104]|nr:MAG: hypothetical protein A4E53_00296 [Pelotomaculum sp. PtaB.Bin104]